MMKKWFTGIALGATLFMFSGTALAATLSPVDWEWPDWIESVPAGPAAM